MGFNIRGHYAIINWPNFNVAVSQGTGRLKKRKRDRKSRLVEQSEHITIIYQVHHLTWVQFVANQNNYNSNTRGRGSQITKANTMKCLKYCKNYEIVTQRHEVSKCYWKNGQTCLMPGCHKLQFVKNEIKPSTTKQGMFLLAFRVAMPS